jgi:hypothetical protein
MRATLDIFEEADLVGTKNEVKDFLTGINKWDLEHLILVVQKSARRFAVFMGETAYLVPNCELPETANDWLQNN